MVDDDLAAVTPTDDALFGDVAGLIDTARTRAAAAVNSELVMLYWSIGKRVREEILGGQRAAYGEQVVKRLAVRLTERYGRGWSRRSVARLVRFADLYPLLEIVPPPMAQLTWTSITVLLDISEQQKREFYAAFAPSSWQAP